jgi:two-component system, OmpR family, phosphate regulon sensor histidine kinase PhoR
MIPPDPHAAETGNGPDLARDFDALMERCGAAVLVLDARGSILRRNANAGRMLHLDDRATCLAALPLHVAVTRILDEAVSSAEPRESEIKSPAGSSLRVSVAPIDACAGEPRYLLAAHDVTELRRLEQVRRDFVANVSHELRTPLASIRAMAETLQDGALSDPSVSNKFLGTIVTEADRLTRISEDLLILSDAESRMPERSRFRLSGLVDELLARFLPQADSAGIELVARIPSRTELYANPDQIEQVLLNLIDNAIKYTSRGGRVEISAETDGSSTSFHVSDSGIGIKAKDLSRIFERFYRVDKARSRQSGGTGLGLAIVKHIVESHGGRVSVKSDFGRGSTFSVTLPTRP